MTVDQLPDDPDALKAMVLARDFENARLLQIVNLTRLPDSLAIAFREGLRKGFFR